MLLFLMLFLPEAKYKGRVIGVFPSTDSNVMEWRFDYAKTR
jgi:hypothetical protein